MRAGERRKLSTRKLYLKQPTRLSHDATEVQEENVRETDPRVNRNKTFLFTVINPQTEATAHFLKGLFQLSDVEN